MMNGWLGPVALRVPERRPSLQGLYRPPTLRLGAGVESFPEITVQQPPNSVAAFAPQTVSDGIVVSAGGIVMALLSQIMPGVAQPITLAGGVGLLGLGGFKIYEAVSGNATPSIKNITPPPDQDINDVSFISGKIVEPSNQGQADIGTIWQALFAGQRTFKIKFIVTNNSPKKQSVLVEFQTTQTSRPLVGSPDVSKFSTTYVLDLAPSETREVPGYQPVKVLESMIEAQSYRSLDIVATLIARMSANESRQKKLDQVSFTAW